MSVMSNRLITFSDEIVDGKPLYVSSNCLPAKALKLEPAGYAFHSAALRLFGCVEEKDVKEEKQETYIGKDPDTAHTFDSYSSNKGKKKSGSGEKEQDHYALLGLSHLRYLATEDQIRKAYRDTALRHHPDKQASLLLAEKTESAKQAKKDEIESHFKAIQEGYEILIDPIRRRIYDSTDEFDDEIPTDCAPQEFFKVFGPAFMRNGRWSVNQPMPSFGDDSTPIQDVDKFYNFWYGFKSWREFPQDDEHDVEQAESRDHKRWMERQNAKLSEKARKEEAVRIRSLVDSAYKRDPRILRRKDEEKAEKLRKKEAKLMVKRLQEEEAVRIVEEEKRKKEEEEKRAAEIASQQKKLREKEKKLVRKERSRLRNLSMTVVSKHLLDLTNDDVEGICMSFNLEQLRNLCDKMEGKEELNRARRIKVAIGGAEDLMEEEETEKKEPQPNGFVEVPHQNGSVEVPHQNGSVEVPHQNGSVEVPHQNGSVEVPHQNGSVEVPHQNGSVEVPHQNGFVEVNLVAANNNEDLSNQNTNCQKSEDSSVTASNISGSDQDSWTAIQEKALVQALKTFPKEASHRWERVATAVPGKTVNQCKKKFALMKETFRVEKTGV